jgi:maleate isomerase
MTDNTRLGVVMPSGNTVVEAWYPAAVPPGVSVHFARMSIDTTSQQAAIAVAESGGMQAVRQIAHCRPHSIAYACTASSIVGGHAFDARIRDEIRRLTGAAATTATDSIFAACRALGLRRVTAVSPYTEAVDLAERRFFAEGGIDIIAGDHLGITDGFALAAPGAEEILDLALGAWDPASDGMIVACLNFRSHLVIDAIEARIGKPVVSSTQAVLWHLLRLAGVDAPISGYGRLLQLSDTR